MFILLVKIVTLVLQVFILITIVKFNIDLRSYKKKKEKKIIDSPEEMSEESKEFIEDYLNSQR